MSLSLIVRIEPMAHQLHIVLYLVVDPVAVFLQVDEVGLVVPCWVGRSGGVGFLDQGQYEPVAFLTTLSNVLIVSLLWLGGLARCLLACFPMINFISVLLQNLLRIRWRTR